ncbi:hypothetical protein BO94DRAFT_126182 [Aspergillus sclerotioniger CBS 115572]|uniref:Uncharacterized protein n=1 Tax=Aspergillus sclerotioniger CBS 115572 TaxID=1450535 RepID=A0A317XFF4_9EURO|nr:hypothetical protein BO94DRAFT_126182 [Aspergillus sclerotioniger CBS 115572]PWY95470.1 hypothetical protein BO94DRAFT_126182 [Aspergillus sclerotioniger CBS 115572]
MSVGTLSTRSLSWNIPRGLLCVLVRYALTLRLSYSTVVRKGGAGDRGTDISICRRGLGSPLHVGWLSCWILMSAYHWIKTWFVLFQGALIRHEVTLGPSNYICI